MASKASTRILTDHDEIRRWAEERGAKPAAVKSTESDDDVGIIRLDFPGYRGEDTLEEISWDEWFRKFDEKNLALVVQDKTANGKPSNFNKLVSRDSVEESAQSGSRRTSSKGKTSRSSRKSAASTGNSRESNRASETANARGSQSGRKKRSTGRKAA